jgi:hypothetical protein
MQFEGEPPTIAQSMTEQRRTQGDEIHGRRVDPLMTILAQLARAFPPSDDVAKIVAMSEMVQFQGRTGETIDHLISRFFGKDTPGS